MGLHGQSFLCAYRYCSHAYSPRKQDRTAALVVSAVLQGFRAIDTACQPKHYNEPLVGEALQKLYDGHGIKREHIFIQTKYTPIGGQDVSKPVPYDATQSITQQVFASFNKSLKDLRTSYLDSYLLHSPLSTMELTLEAWRVLINLQDSGKVRLIGLSNAYDVSLLENLSRERKVQVIQNRWYEGNNWDEQVVKYCKTNGIFYQSFWTLTGSPSLLSHPSVTEISKQSGATPAQVVYKVCQLHGLTPLSGTTNEIHMKQDVAVENLDFSRYADVLSSVLSV